MAEGEPIKDWRQMRDEERARRRETMRSWRRSRVGDRPRGNPMVGGVVLLIVGSVFLLSNLGIVGPYFWRDFWPAVVIVIGAMQLIFRRGLFERMWGGWMMAMGSLFLAHTMGFIQGNIWALAWPMAMILMGVMFLLKGSQRRWGIGPDASSSAGSPFSTMGTAGPHVLDENAIFGGIQRRVDSQEFEGGQISAVFGGVHLDLRGAGTTKDAMVIEANAIFGGVELLVPDSWDVTVRGEAVFGGFEDKTMRRREPLSGKRPHLTITGSAVFGGVSVT